VSRPTPEQQAALDVHDASVGLVSGAGCGKTRVLTERYLRSLQGTTALPLPSILALTFTEKAARELRDRVRRACRDRLAVEPDSARWRAVRTGLEAAPISTFHGFCTGVLRAFPIEARVEPGFRVLDESLAGVLRRQALDDALRRRLIEGDSADRALILRLGLKGTREVVSELVNRRAGRDYATWRDLTAPEIADLWRARHGEIVVATARESLARRAAKPLGRLRPEDCANAALRTSLLEIQSGFRGLSSAGANALEALRELCVPQGNMRSSDWPSTEIKNEVRNARGKLLELVEEALAVTRWDADLAGRMATETFALCRLACDAIDAYAARKRRSGVLDFDDLQAAVLELLRNGPEDLVGRIRASVRMILVDEFQDTDPTQAEILERLAGEGLASGRLFLVGDVKQSIYAFRGAAPELLDRFRDRFPKTGRLQLTRNFRGIPALVRFTNALFGDVFPRPEDRLRPSRPDPVRIDFPSVTLLVGEADENSPKVSAARRRMEEAGALARLLRSRLESGWTIADPVDGRPRRAVPGDVVVLLRTHAQATAIERALLNEGFDYHVAGGGTFYAQPEVLDLINLLTSIEDPTDEIALVGLLRSPIIGVSDEALYWLSRSPSGSIAEGVSKPELWSELPAADQARMARGAELLARWRRSKDRLSIGDLLERALDESGYEAILLAERHGSRMRANCRKLVRIARAFDAHGGLGLSDFVERLQADYESPPRETQEATSDELGDAIRIMTVHQAKGLEFPIVVVPSLDREGPRRAERVSYLAEFGPILHGASVDGEAENSSEGVNPIEWLARNHLANREREEELRVFYVAVTRARDALILSSSRSAGVPSDATALRLLLDRFDLATGAFTGPAPDDPDANCPGIEIVGKGEPRSSEPRKPVGERPRSRLLSIARDVERAVEASSWEVEAPQPKLERPSLLDLDAGLGGARFRPLRELVRLAFEDRRLHEGGGLAWSEAIEEACSRLVPAAGRMVAAEARRRLERWPDLGERRVLEIRTGLTWVRRWSKTLCHGRTELAMREPNGWQFVHAAIDVGDKLDLACERLRAALALAALGQDRFDVSRLVIFGPDSTREERWTSPIDPPEIDALLDQVVERLARATIIGS
jgi:ATP-dependent helicase/nuclease subunit A